MIPAVPQLVKVMTVILAGSVVLAPIPKVEPVPQAGKVTNIVTKVIKDKKNKKLPIIAGYKKGNDPLPKGTTPSKVRSKIWQSIKNDLGLE